MTFKVTVLSKSGGVKFTYSGRFDGIREAIDYYESSGGRVIEIKEVGVRLKPVRVRWDE